MLATLPPQKGIPPTAPGTRFASNDKGANTVEFALIAPILLLLLLGIAYVSVYLSVGHSLAQMAADASRYAMVGLDQEEREELANRWASDENHSYGLIDQRKLVVSTSETDGALRVTLAYSLAHLPTPPIIGSVMALPETLERSSTVLVQ